MHTAWLSSWIRFHPESAFILNVQYYTDRTENTRIVDGKSQIIVLKEENKDFDYTPALLETGRMTN